MHIYIYSDFRPPPPSTPDPSPPTTRARKYKEFRLLYLVIDKEFISVLARRHTRFFLLTWNLSPFTIVGIPLEIY